jgi:Zn-dependent protease with chaperone function
MEISMPKRMLLWGLVAALVAGAAACAPTTGGTIAGDNRSQFLAGVSPERVNGMALQYYRRQNDEARGKGVLIGAGAEYERVLAIMRRLVPHVGVFRPDARQWPWELALIDAPTVNAHVMPGGKVTFYTGLIRELQLDDDEIAAVMGHEIAHALREHTREKMAQQQATGLLLAIGGAALGIGDGALQLAGLARELALDLPFSRTMESEADVFGMELAARAGYDPRAAVSLWRKMSAHGDGGGPAFLSTHPDSQGRRSALERLVPRVMPLYEAAAR